jgi:hypothetical protein
MGDYEMIYPIKTFDPDKDKEVFLPSANFTLSPIISAGLSTVISPAESPDIGQHMEVAKFPSTNTSATNLSLKVSNKNIKD